MSMKASTRAAAAVKPPKIPKPLRMPCCKCIGAKGQVTWINSGSAAGSVPWLVAGPGVTNPVAVAIIAGTMNSNWTATLSPANWVQPNSSDGGIDQPAGIYNYDLSIEIPCCTIPMAVTLVGEAAGDDQISVFADNLAAPIAETDVTIAVPGSAPPGAGGWGFKAERIVSFAHTFTTPGIHLLRIEVNNGGGPHGLLVRAALTTICSTQMEHPSEGLGEAPRWEGDGA